MGSRRWFRRGPGRFRDGWREAFPAGIWRPGRVRGGGGDAGGAAGSRGEPNLYPADARQVLPEDPYSLGMRSLAAFHLAGGGFGQAQEVIEARTGVTAGRAQLTGLAEDLAAWTGDFYAGRSRDAEEEEQPDSDVIMMQGDGNGNAMRPDTPRNPGNESVTSSRPTTMSHT